MAFIFMSLETSQKEMLQQVEYSILLEEITARRMMKREWWAISVSKEQLIALRVHSFDRIFLSPSIHLNRHRQY